MMLTLWRSMNLALMLALLRSINGKAYRGNSEGAATAGGGWAERDRGRPGAPGRSNAAMACSQLIRLSSCSQVSLDSLQPALRTIMMT